MIKTIVFDFGNVFINLDKFGAIKNASKLFKIKQFPKELLATNALYEQGLITTKEFLEFYLNHFPHLNKKDIIDVWNYILKDFPQHRLTWLKTIAKENKYTLILLSNINCLHVEWIKNNISFYEDFKNCFNFFYLSHEIHLRKPNSTIFQFILDTHNLNAQECIFIDDTKQHTDAARTLGFNVWNIDETSEDITTLFKTQSHLF